MPFPLLLPLLGAAFGAATSKNKGLGALTGGLGGLIAGPLGGALGGAAAPGVGAATGAGAGATAGATAGLTAGQAAGGAASGLGSIFGGGFGKQLALGALKGGVGAIGNIQQQKSQAKQLNAQMEAARQNQLLNAATGRLQTASQIRANADRAQLSAEQQAEEAQQRALGNIVQGFRSAILGG